MSMVEVQASCYAISLCAMFSMVQSLYKLVLGVIQCMNAGVCILCNNRDFAFFVFERT